MVWGLAEMVSAVASPTMVSLFTVRHTTCQWLGGP